MFIFTWFSCVLGSAGLLYHVLIFISILYFQFLLCFSLSVVFVPLSFTLLDSLVFTVFCLDPLTHSLQQIYLNSTQKHKDVSYS